VRVYNVSLSRYVLWSIWIYYYLLDYLYIYILLTHCIINKFNLNLYLPRAVNLFHVIVSAYVEYKRKIGHVVAGPVRLIDQVAGEVVVHHVSG